MKDWLTWGTVDYRKSFLTTPGDFACAINLGIYP